MTIVGDCPNCMKGILRRNEAFCYPTSPPLFEFVCEQCSYKTVKNSEGE